MFIHSVTFTRSTGEDGTLWLIDVDGDNERPLLGETKQAKHPAWSPDGQRNVDLDSVKVKFIDGVPYLCWILPPDPHWGLRVVDVTSRAKKEETLQQRITRLVT